MEGLTVQRVRCSVSLMKKDRLTTAEITAELGIKPSTWRSYVARGYAPKPDGHLDARTPYWFRSTIDTHRSTQRKATAVRKSIIALTLAVAALLSACSSQSPVERHLDAYWSDLSESGQQRLCLTLTAKGDDWFAEEVGTEHADEAVEFFTEACEDVELPSAQAVGFGIPL